MQIVAVQPEVAWEQRERNHATVRRLLEADPPQMGALVVLPEMFASGFSMNVNAIADDDGATETFLRGIARERSIFIVAGVVTRAAESQGRDGRNQAVVIDPSGAVIARYTKIHLFAYGQEDKHYTPGDEIVLFRWHEFIVAPFICYDLRFPEIFRHASRAGANLFCVIASWPDTRAHHWTTLLQARAIENQAYIVGVNRVGTDPKLQFSGQSLIIDPSGKILADAGEAERIAWANVDCQRVTEYREGLPFLKDLRTDFLA